MPAELVAAAPGRPDRVVAHHALARAREIATRTPTGRWLPRLARSSRPPGPPAAQWRTGVEALTPSELRVARLAAEGRSNREISYELYVTLKARRPSSRPAIYALLGIVGRR